MNLYAVAKLIGCFGIKGWLKVQPFANEPKRLDALDHVYIGQTPDSAESAIVEGVSFHQRSVIMKLKGYDDRTMAGGLVGAFIFVEERDAIQPKRGRYYVHDVIGARVYSSDGGFVGILEEVFKTPAHDLWAVRRNKKLYLIPAVKEFVKSVDIKERKVVINLIEGLVEE